MVCDLERVRQLFSRGGKSSALPLYLFALDASNAVTFVIFTNYHKRPRRDGLFASLGAVRDSSDAGCGGRTRKITWVAQLTMAMVSQTRAR